MKPSNVSGNAILKTDDGKAYGFFLAADYTAEHEQGIARLQSLFGIAGGDGDFIANVSTIDVSNRIQTGNVKSTYYPERSRKKQEIKGKFLTTDEYLERNPESKLQIYDPKYECAGAFDERNFALGCYSDEAIELMKVIQEGIAAKDIAIWISGSGNPFGRGGLAIARASLIPTELIAQYDKHAQDLRDLKADALATGIAQRLRDGIKCKNGWFKEPYFALSPRRPFQNDKETAHPVIFFLNPVDQTNHAFGWFTVEELDEWIQGRGPVIENSKAAKAKAKAETEAQK